MSPTYLHPDVYLEELETHGPRRAWQRVTAADLPPNAPPKPRWVAEHSIAGFVGFARRGPIDEPTLVTSWSNFSQIFGGFDEIYYKSQPQSSTQHFVTPYLSHSVYGFFQNGGSACYIVRLNGMAPEDFLGDGATPQGIGCLTRLTDLSVVCVPDLMLAYQLEELDLPAVHAVQLGLINQCEQMLDRLAILDPPPGLSPQQLRTWRVEESRYDSARAALYYPWVRVFDPSWASHSLVPPSGYVAGLFAQSDLFLGPHRTPANEPILGPVAVEVDLIDGEMDLLTANGVNFLLYTAQRGVVVWGSRTLSSDPAARYVRKARLMHFIIRNLRRGTDWAIFQPARDRGVWARIVRDIEDLFTLLWTSGALYGVTPEEAFSVRCDEETNSDDFQGIKAECVIVLEPGREVGFRVVYWSG